MDDLISRAAAITGIGELIREYREKGEDATADGLILSRRYVVKTLPAVDAAPAVRCRDCKHRIVNKNAGKKGYMGLEAMCDLDTGDIFELGRNAEDPDWFCADGERRDNDAAD